LTIKNVKQWHCVDSIYGVKVEDEFFHLVFKAAG